MTDLEVVREASQEIITELEKYTKRFPLGDKAQALARLVLAMLPFAPSGHTLLCPMSSLRPTKCDCEYGEWCADLALCASEIRKESV